MNENNNDIKPQVLVFDTIWVNVFGLLIELVTATFQGFGWVLGFALATGVLGINWGRLLNGL